MRQFPTPDDTFNSAGASARWGAGIITHLSQAPRQPSAQRAAAEPISRHPLASQDYAVPLLNMSQQNGR